MAKYTTQKDGEPFVVPVGVRYPIRCCDCGLVHDMVFNVNAKGEVEITATRNNRATAASRRTT